jgi:hypothetical protein
MDRALLVLLAGFAAAVFAEAAAPAPFSDAAQMSRIVEAYSDFAGSAQNAQSLAEGLHNGTTVTLIDPSNAPRSFTPVTKPMGWRDVKVAIAIAQAELANAGIPGPTPVDIEAVLNGGTAGSGVTMANFTGVLTQHWSGLAWQQIVLAHNLNSDLLASSAMRPAPVEVARAAALSSAPLRQGVTAVPASARTAAAVVQ